MCNQSYSTSHQPKHTLIVHKISHFINLGSLCHKTANNSDTSFLNLLEVPQLQKIILLQFILVLLEFCGGI